MVTRAAGRTLAFLLSFALLAATAGAAAAAITPFPQDFSFDERGVRADAYWQTCEKPDSEGVTHCVTINASLFDGRQHNRDPQFGHVNDAFSYLCVHRTEDAYAEAVGPVGEPINEGGCVMQPDITVDGLDRVEVSTTLDLVQEVCVIVDPETGETICEPGASRTVSVDLTFIGTGELLTDRWVSNGTSIVDGVRCHMRTASAGTGRDAIASILVGEEDPGASQFAFLADGRTRMAQRCAS
jgi:hypothetical protein